MERPAHCEVEQGRRITECAHCGGAPRGWKRHVERVECLPVECECGVEDQCWLRNAAGLAHGHRGGRQPRRGGDGEEHAEFDWVRRDGIRDSRAIAVWGSAEPGWRVRAR